MEDDDDLITVQDFANNYRVDASVVRSWVKHGFIDYVLDGPRKLRKIRKSELLKPIEGGTNGQQGSNQKGAGRREKKRAR